MPDNDLFKNSTDKTPFKPLISPGPDPLGDVLKTKTESRARATAEKIMRTSNIPRTKPIKGEK